MNRRLYPLIWDYDYAVLNGLKKTIIEAIGKYVIGQSRKLTLLDFGCGDIPYKPLFETHLSHYIACDVKGNPKADLLIEDNGRIPTKTESVDIVLSIQVLEHVPDVDSY